MRCCNIVTYDLVGLVFVDLVFGVKLRCILLCLNWSPEIMTPLLRIHAFVLAFYNEGLRLRLA